MDVTLSLICAVFGKRLIVSRASAPAWIRRDAWSVTTGGLRWSYGVGAVRGLRNRALLVRSAEERARERLASIAAGSSLSASKAIDWYEDPDGDFYALVVLPPPVNQ
jgi:hypothetical protein